MNCKMSIPNAFAETILRLRRLKNGSALLFLMQLFILVISFLLISGNCGWTHCPRLLRAYPVNFMLFLASYIPHYIGFSFWLICVTYLAYTVTVFRVTFATLSC